MTQGLQHRVKFIDGAFKQFYMLFRNIRLRQIQAGHIGHHGHQQLLHIKDGFFYVVPFYQRTGQAQRGSDFIQVPVRFYPCRTFGNAFPGIEPGGSLIACTGIDCSFFRHTS